MSYDVTANILPSFESGELSTLPERLQALLDANLTTINSLVSNISLTKTWDNLIYPLEDLDDAIERFWSPISHLHAVKNTLTHKYFIFYLL